MDSLRCTVCYEQFDEDDHCPRVLHCGHTFCNSCLKSLIDDQHNICCPTCRSIFTFITPKFIPINYFLKSLIETNSKSRTNSGEFLSEGFCNAHETYNGMRCMDCEAWICEICSTMQHKRCRTLAVKEAYKELMRQVPREVEQELENRKTYHQRLTESLVVLDVESKSLVEQKRLLSEVINEKDLMLERCAHMKFELESVKSEEKNDCDHLKQMQVIAKNSANDIKFAVIFKELDRLLQKLKRKVPPTLEVLGTLCQNGPVYVVEDSYDGTRYGQVTVKDAQIWIDSFQLRRPDAVIIPFKNFLFHFSKSTAMPKRGFLRVTPEGSGVDDSFVIEIETEGDSLRAKNFILLCSALKGSSYKGLTLKTFGPSFIFQISQAPPPVVDGIRYDDFRIPLLKEAGVYGIWKNNSGFAILLRDYEFTYPHPKFGDVVSGLNSLKESQGKSQSPKESQGKSQSPKESQGMSQSPKESREMSQSPKESQGMSQSPKESREMSQSPKESRGMSRSPKDSQEKSQSPKESQGMSQSPKESREMSQSPKESRGMSLSPKDSQEKSQSPKESRGMSQSPKESPGMSQSPKESRGMSQSPKESPGTSQSPKASRGTSQSPKDSPGTSQSPKESQRMSQSPKESRGMSQSPKESQGKSFSVTECGIIFYSYRL